MTNEEIHAAAKQAVFDILNWSTDDAAKKAEKPNYPTERIEGLLLDMQQKTVDKAWQWINEGNTFDVLKARFYKAMEGAE